MSRSGLQRQGKGNKQQMEQMMMRLYEMYFTFELFTSFWIIHFFISRQHSQAVELSLRAVILTLQFAMSDSKHPPIIEIDSEKEENSSKKTQNASSKPDKMPSLQMKFDHAMFPKLASLLKRNPSIVPKTETIEVVDVTESQIIQVSSPSAPLPIVPMKEDSPEKQATILTRYDPDQNRISVVQDLKGILVPQLSFYLNKTRQKLADFSAQKAVPPKQNEQSIAHDAIVISDEVQVQKVLVAQVEKNKSVPEASKQQEMIHENQETAPQIEVAAAPEKQKCCQNVVQTQLGGPNVADSKQNVPQAMQAEERQVIQPVEQQQQVQSNVNYNEGEPQSMQVEKPSSEPHSSVFVYQSPAVEASNVNSGMECEILEKPEIEVAANNNPEISNKAIPLPNSDTKLMIAYAEKGPLVLLPEVTGVIQSIQPQKESEISQQPSEIEKNVQLEIHPVIECSEEGKKPEIVSQIKQKQASTLEERKQSQIKRYSDSDISNIKKIIIHYIPELALNINNASSEEIMEIYNMIRTEMNVDLFSVGLQGTQEVQTGISKQKEVQAPAQTQQINLIQKQTESQQPQPMQESANRKEQSKQVEKSQERVQQDAIQQFEKLKDCDEEELRKRLGQYFPESKDVLSSMNFLELRQMVEQTLKELNLSSQKEGQREQQKPPEVIPQIQNEVPYSEQKAPEIIEQPKPQEILQSVQVQQSQQVHSEKNTNVVQTIQHALPNQSLVIETPAEAEVSEVRIESQKVVEKTNFTTISQLRSSLLKKMPELTQEISSISDNQLQNLMTSHAPQMIKEPEPQKKPQKELLPSKPIAQPSVKPSIEQIINQTMKFYPAVAADLKNMNEDYVRDVYENVILKIGFMHASPSKEQQKQAQEFEIEKKSMKVSEPSEKASAKQSEKRVVDKSSSSESPMKRTYQEMITSNQKKDDEGKTGQKKERKKKFSPNEIRKMLIVKLPQLKSNIMMLDDAQIETIFYEGIESGKTQTTVPQGGVSQANQPKPVEQPQKTVIGSTQKKPIETISPISLTSKFGENVQVVETYDEKRQRKVRTVIMVQSEFDCAQNGGQAMSKMVHTDNGIVKKCNCECCKKLDVKQLLRRLTDLLEGQK